MSECQTALAWPDHPQRETSVWGQWQCETCLLQCWWPCWLPCHAAVDSLHADSVRPPPIPLTKHRPHTQWLTAVNHSLSEHLSITPLTTHTHWHTDWQLSITHLGNLSYDTTPYYKLFLMCAQKLTYVNSIYYTKPKKLKSGKKEITDMLRTFW